MAQPPTAASDAGAGVATAGDFLPVLTTAETDQPAALAAAITTALKGTTGSKEQEEEGKAREAILGGLSGGSLGQTIALPAPRLVHDFRLSAALERKVALGRSCWGERNWIGICGGEWSATWGRGKIVVSCFDLFVPWCCCFVSYREECVAGSMGWR